MRKKGGWANKTKLYQKGRFKLPNFGIFFFFYCFLYNFFVLNCDFNDEKGDIFLNIKFDIFRLFFECIKRIVRVFSTRELAILLGQATSFRGPPYVAYLYVWVGSMLCPLERLPTVILQSRPRAIPSSNKVPTRMQCPNIVWRKDNVLFTSLLIQHIWFVIITSN